MDTFNAEIRVLDGDGEGSGYLWALQHAILEASPGTIVTISSDGERNGERAIVAFRLR